MSVEATVETEHGERILLWHPNGLLGGKAIASFLGALDLYCLGSDKFEDVRHGFARLESVLGGSICDLTAPLVNGHYYGSWDYVEEDYERFSAQNQGRPLSKAEFKQILQQLANMWVPVEEMLHMVTILVDLLAKADLEATGWYDPQDTLADFLALKEAIEIANRAPDCKMRIQFS
jgi:hypothetical protein